MIMLWVLVFDLTIGVRLPWTHEPSLYIATRLLCSWRNEQYKTTSQDCWYLQEFVGRLELRGNKVDIRYNIVGITSNILNTYQMNPTAWVRPLPRLETSS